MNPKGKFGLAPSVCACMTVLLVEPVWDAVRIEPVSRVTGSFVELQVPGHQTHRFSSVFALRLAECVNSGAASGRVLVFGISIR